jgi:ribulose-5-phosphate 4-epimerase/fuculose-1-phosphate aldolase
MGNKSPEVIDASLKYNLACAYQIASHLKLDDHTYTHLSARPKGANYYYIYPFGLTFAQVRSDNLLQVTLDGEILEGNEYQYNSTGYIIHGSIYKARPDLSSVFHVHTPATVAVSAIKKGLLPISQWALHFYDKISYHNYHSLALEFIDHSDPIAKDLGENYVMLLRNHGAITCGHTVHEAMFYLYHLEQACKTQILALSTKSRLVTISKKICKKANHDLLNFEKDLGKRDWEAWISALGL